MTSIIAHLVLNALLMLATSDECPPADWYPEGEYGETIVINKCAIPLAPEMTRKDALTFYRTARKLAGR
jgi:hypothetical protein